MAAAGLVIALVVAVVAVQLTRVVPDPVVTTAMVTETAAVPGVPPTLPWPPSGEAAVAVPGRGLVITSGSEAPVPIASLTKMMTAYVVLLDHPLTPTAPGPTVTITADEQNEANTDADDGDTSIPVLVGEVLTERQLLDGLLVRSANNFADLLAQWDAGSITAFVARMNEEASSLGMHHTHYADASGLNPQSMSTAGDLLRVATAAMADHTFADVVQQRTVTLPVAGPLPNYVNVIGTDGIVGIKSGFTQAAMGCLVLAADRLVDGRTVRVMAAVTGQPGLKPLDTAAAADTGLVNAVASALRERPILPDHAEAATVGTPWHDTSVPADTGRPLTLLEWPGDVVRMTFIPTRVRLGARAGTRAGTLVVRDGAESATLAVRTTASVTPPPLTWRLGRL